MTRLRRLQAIPTNAAETAASVFGSGTADTTRTDRPAMLSSEFPRLKTTKSMVSPATNERSFKEKGICPCRVVAPLKEELKSITPST
jgi:hypothetical protein